LAAASRGERVVAHEEVGEPDELLGGEHRLIDDRDGGVGQRRRRRGHRSRDGRGIRRSRLGQFHDTSGILRAVGLELAQLVLRAEPTGALEGEVFGLDDRRHRPSLASIARSHANSHSAAAFRSLALQTMRAPSPVSSMYRMSPFRLRR
jgi:hypothetical protein